MSFSIVDGRGRTLRIYPTREEAEARMDDVMGASDIIEETKAERESREVEASNARQDRFYRAHPRG